MKVSKKLISLALAAMLLLSLAAPAMAADSDFVIEDGVLTAYNGPGGNVVIPDGVTKIGMFSFIEKTEVTGVTIPKGVTEISEFAFGRCSNLASVSIPSSVTLIGGYAFSECSSLKSVTIPEGVTELGGCAFLLCTSLTSVTLPTSVTTMRGSVFSECTSLTSITVPASLTDPGAYPFCAGPNLTDVYYGGTEEQWLALNGVSSIQEAKEYNRMGIGDATVHYNSTGPETPTTPTTPTTPSFSDVPANAYYAEPVAWAVEKGITNGTSSTTFSPETTCNTAQILTFLWRASGKPEATESTLTDVKSTDYFYGAAQWAKSKGMTSGDTLSPETPCTRASTVLFIWQAAGSPAVDTKTSFTDVPADADYAMAVAWAVENGVTTGTSATAFSPDQTCTRGQIATFLYRAFAE